MHNEIFDKTQNINQFILSGIDSNNSGPERIEFRNHIFELMRNNGFAARVNNKTRNRMELEYGNVFGEKCGDAVTYRPLKPEIGVTFLPLVLKGSKSGIIYRINISENSEPEKKFSGASSVYVKKFGEILDLVLKFIREYAGREIYVNGNSFKDIYFEITDLSGKIVPDNVIDGDSIDLPLALALLSFLLDMPVPVDFISTGKLVNDKIMPVDGLEAKLRAASVENEEVQRAVIPGGCGNGLADKIPDLALIPVHNFPEAVEICLPDFKNYINRINRNGFVICEFGIVNIEGLNVAADELKFTLNRGEKVTPLIIKSFKNYDWQDRGSKILIINNAVVNWFTSAVALYFKNVYKVIAVYDPKVVDGGGAVIVHSSDENFRLGSVIKSSGNII